MRKLCIIHNVWLRAFLHPPPTKTFCLLLIRILCVFFFSFRLFVRFASFKGMLADYYTTQNRVMHSFFISYTHQPNVDYIKYHRCRRLVRIYTYYMICGWNGTRAMDSTPELNLGSPWPSWKSWCCDVCSVTMTILPISCWGARQFMVC